jgi:hypothetical protein
MSKPKFDGPSFVNPSHTSYGLNNNGGYQTPQVNVNNNSNLQKNNINTIQNVKKGPKGIKIFFD